MSRSFIILTLLLTLALLTTCLGRGNPSTEQEEEPIDTVAVRIVDWNKEDKPITENSVDDQDSVLIIDPYATIDRIFTAYIEFQESTDLEQNKDSLRQAIPQIGRGEGEIDSTSLQLLLNVWMYYDPTDFPTRSLVEARLREEVASSIEAVDVRWRNRKEWEREDGAPFAELQDSEGRIQVYFNRDEICPGEDKTAYNELYKKLLDIGDFIGIHGELFTTQDTTAGGIATATRAASASAACPSRTGFPSSGALIEDCQAPRVRPAFSELATRSPSALYVP